jgi:hypothetical protein
MHQTAEAYPHEIGPRLDCADDTGRQHSAIGYLSAEFFMHQHMDVRVSKRWIT